MVAEKKLQEKAIYNKKFTDFDKKYEAKNDWYQQNIIQPQIEKHLTDFDKEKVYNEKYLIDTISKEQIVAQKARDKEKKVFETVQKQMNDRKVYLQKIQQQKEKEKYDTLK